MQTKEITFFHLKELVEHTNAYMVSMGRKKNALSVRIEKTSISMKAAIGKYNSIMEDIRYDHASVDLEGNMIFKEGLKGEDRFSFKPEKLKKMRLEMLKIDEQKVSIDINITGDVPKDISYAQSKYFRGILIPEDYVYEEPVEAVEINKN